MICATCAERCRADEMKIMLNPAELDDFVAWSQQESHVPRRIHIPGPVDDHDPVHDVVGGRSFFRARSIAYAMY